MREHEDQRDRLQTDVNRLHREHVDRRAELDAGAGAHATTRRGAWRSSRRSWRKCARTRAHAKPSCARARGRMEKRHRRAGGARAAAARARAGARAHAHRVRGGTRRGAGGAAARARTGAASRIAALIARLADTTALERVEKQLEESEAAPRRSGARSSRDGEAPLAAAQTQLERALQRARGDRARNCRRQARQR